MAAWNGGSWGWNSGWPYWAWDNDWAWDGLWPYWAWGGWWPVWGWDWFGWEPDVGLGLILTSMSLVSADAGDSFYPYYSYGPSYGYGYAYPFYNDGYPIYGVPIW